MTTQSGGTEMCQTGGLGLGLGWVFFRVLKKIKQPPSPPEEEPISRSFYPAPFPN